MNQNNVFVYLNLLHSYQVSDIFNKFIRVRANKMLNMRITYWISTIVLCVFLLWSAYTYLLSKSTIEGIKDLGFPDFFRIQLAVLKLAAVVILLTPQVPIAVKEWAYAGVGLFFITAIVAHFAHKDPIFINVINLILIVILVVSYVSFHKIKTLS